MKNLLLFWILILQGKYCSAGCKSYVLYLLPIPDACHLSTEVWRHSDGCSSINYPFYSVSQCSVLIGFQSFYYNMLGVCLCLWASQISTFALFSRGEDFSVTTSLNKFSMPFSFFSPSGIPWYRCYFSLYYSSGLSQCCHLFFSVTLFLYSPTLCFWVNSLLLLVVIYCLDF